MLSPYRTGRRVREPAARRPVAGPGSSWADGAGSTLVVTGVMGRSWDGAWTGVAGPAVRGPASGTARNGPRRSLTSAPEPDDLAEGAHGHAALLFGQRLPGAQEIAGAGRLALASDADRERRDLGRADALVFEGEPIQDESDAPRIVRAQDLGQRGIEERLETPPQRALDEPGIEKRREGVRRRKPHHGTLPRHEAQWRDPTPRGPVTRGPPPRRGGGGGGSPRPGPRV